MSIKDSLQKNWSKILVWAGFTTKQIVVLTGFGAASLAAFFLLFNQGKGLGSDIGEINLRLATQEGKTIVYDIVQPALEQLGIKIDSLEDDVARHGGQLDILLQGHDPAQ